MHQYGKYLTKEKSSYMGKMSAIAREAKRLAEADYDPVPIRSGMQMGFLHWDTRTPVFRYHFGLLIGAGYANRYRLILGNERQPGLISFLDAVSESARNFGHVRMD